MLIICFRQLLRKETHCKVLHVGILNLGSWFLFRVMISHGYLTLKPQQEHLLDGLFTACINQTGLLTPHELDILPLSCRQSFVNNPSTIKDLWQKSKHMVLNSQIDKEWPFFQHSWPCQYGCFKFLWTSINSEILSFLLSKNYCSSSIQLKNWTQYLIM